MNCLNRAISIDMDRCAGRRVLELVKEKFCHIKRDR